MKRVFLLFSVALAGGALAGTATLREQVDRLRVESICEAVKAVAESSPSRCTEEDRVCLASLAARKEALLTNFSEDAARLWLKDVKRLLLADVGFDVERVAVVRRAHGNLGLPANWSAVREIGLNGLTNEIAILTGLRSAIAVKPLYQPHGDTFCGEMTLHWDAGKCLFTERMPGTASRVKELDLANGAARELPLIPDSDVDNYAGCYLPDESLLFLSTASFIGVPCVRGSSFVAHLYRYWPATGKIRRLTFDQEHNWNPTVLDDGRVLYLRWEYSDIPHYAARILFTMNPDGTGQRAFYGSNSYWPNGVFFPKQMPGTPLRVAGIVSGHHGVPRMGELVVFEPGKGRFEADGVVCRVGTTNRVVKPVILDKLVDESWPKFLHPVPMGRNAFLVSAKPTPQSLWGLYYADTFGNLMLLHEDPRWAILEPMPLVSRKRPQIFPESVDEAKTTGLVKIIDIYSGPGLKDVPRGTVKQVRVYSYSFSYRGMGGQWDRVGFDGPWDVRRILGTVPVEADGSVLFEVPANTPVAFQPLDGEGRAVQTMRSWVTVMPGEMQSCAGCHEDANSSIGAESSRLALQKPPARIAPWHGPARGFTFNSEVQPVLDAYCVRCHDGTQAKPDLRLRPDVHAGMPSKSYDEPAHFPPAYLALKRFVRGYTMESDMHLLNPYEYHATTTELVRMLERGHKGVRLSAEAWDRLSTWIDMNTPTHGTWTEICGTNRVAKMAERQRELNRRYGGPDVDLEAASSAAALPPVTVPVVEKNAAAAEPECKGWPFDAVEATNRLAACGETSKVLDLGEGVKLELVRIPAGRYVTGEGTPRLVEITKPFWIGRTEVSNRQYALFDPSHDSRIERDAYLQFGAEERGDPLNLPAQPVCHVSWQRAEAFCKWLSARSGLACMLPSGEQWEWAGRAGVAGKLNFGACNADFSKSANLADASFYQVKRFVTWGLPYGALPPWRPAVTNVNDGFRVSAPVGSFAPNAWGLCDVHGNVAEWTGDLAADGLRRVARGGSWWSLPQRATFGVAWPYVPWQSVYDVGFRVMAVEQ